MQTPQNPCIYIKKSGYTNTRIKKVANCTNIYNQASKFIHCNSNYYVFAFMKI